MKATLEIAVELQELTREQGLPSLVVYLFDLRDRLLAKSTVKTDPAKPGTGHVEFEVESQGEPVVVKLAPEVEKLRVLQRYNQRCRHRYRSHPILVGSTRRRELLAEEDLWDWCWHAAGGQPQNRPLQVD